MNDLLGEISTSIVVDDTLFLAYDESAAIERLRWKGDKYTKHKTFELDDFFDLPDGKGEMDIEGLAWEKPYLWFTGSMSLKRNEPNPDDDDEKGAAKLLEIDTDDNRFTLGRIPCEYDEDKNEWTPVQELETTDGVLKGMIMEGGTRSTVLSELLSVDDHIAPFMKIPCKENGFDIEGLAVQGERIFLGLRGPVLSGWATVIEFGVHERNGYLHMDGRGDDEKPYRKHFIKMAGMGIREINVDPETNDLLILAGPTMDLDGTISAWRIKGGLPEKPISFTHDPERMFDVVDGTNLEHGKDKAEGMAILNDGNYLITFDSPREDRFEGDRGVWVDVYKGQ